MKSRFEDYLYSIRQFFLVHDSATTAEISKHLTISFPTATKLLENMEKQGEVALEGLDESSGGRRAKRYRYNPHFKQGLSVYVEKNELGFTVFNSFGEVLEEGTVAASLGQGDVTPLIQLVSGLLNRFPRISALSVGVPASVNEIGEIIHAPQYEGLLGLNLREIIEAEFGTPTTIENDMNAAVLGYCYSDSYVEPSSSTFIYLYFGHNGPGAGLLVNGELVRGKSHFTGEISFVPQSHGKNFGQSLPHEQVSPGSLQGQGTDAVAQLVATFTSIINPHSVIFSDQEINSSDIANILQRSCTYIPETHLPDLVISNWSKDYLRGLQRLCIELLLDQTSTT
ncbi:ROK family protein [Rossellomorea marisflavi]|uniref:ROK family transcriptional regulator n=1 Tax=Rossellomorea marisflavi TaxID=189381 RepID=UPI00296EF840|nr:ROK family protein [Rossellomorea marisflavi]MDW4525407.1 ROK family protein [Rossellomorea marisflavi]